MRPTKILPMTNVRRVTLLAVAALSSAMFATVGVARAQAPENYEAVDAIFQARCVVCHAGAGAPLGLRLSDLESLLRGSANGPVVVPGDPDASELIRRLEGSSLPRMPLTGPPFLSESEIETIRTWIASGDIELAPAAAASDEPAAEERPASTFEAVEAILLSRCVVCHVDGGRMGDAPEGLTLSSYDRVIAGGDRVVVTPGLPLASELYRRVVGMSQPRMPFGGPYLSESEVDLIGRWIAEGAPDATGEEASLALGAPVRLGGTLTALWELDGLLLVVTDDTRQEDEDLSPGDRVEVRGVLTEEGLLVERIRRR